MRERTDRTLVELAQQGDRTAIGELFSRYWRAARAAAFGVTGEFGSAEDAASDAFVEALAGIHSLRDPDRFGAWLRTIVVRKARLGLESRHATLDTVAENGADRNELPDNALERRELEAVIQSAIRELPEPLREAIALFYFEGYDTDEGALFLDIPPGTFRRRLHDGRKHLRNAAERILHGSKPLNDAREREIERLKRLMDDNHFYRALRESLVLRPPPSQLIDLFMRRPATTTHVRGRTGSQDAAGSPRDMAQRFLRPSDRASDPDHAVGSMAIAIQEALPDFRVWALDITAAGRLLTFQGEYRDRLQAVLPPGFAEGRPGAFLRRTRALLVLNENGAVQSTYEHLQASPDQATFGAAQQQMRMSDVVDLTWMAAGVVELRAVQELLESLLSSVLPSTPARFSGYDEPRYRSALQLHLGNVAARAAAGGVLNEWAGRPAMVDAAHVRIFLEPWASVRSGQIVEFDRVPGPPWPPS